MGVYSVNISAGWNGNKKVGGGDFLLPNEIKQPNLLSVVQRFRAGACRCLAICRASCRVRGCVKGKVTHSHLKICYTETFSWLYLGSSGVWRSEKTLIENKCQMHREEPCTDRLKALRYQYDELTDGYSTVKYTVCPWHPSVTVKLCNCLLRNTESTSPVGLYSNDLFACLKKSFTPRGPRVMCLCLICHTPTWTGDQQLFQSVSGDLSCHNGTLRND